MDDLKKKSSFQMGIIAHIAMSRANEKLYFRTGLLYSKLNFEDEKVNYYKIPFQFEYLYPKGIFKPRIAYGMNFYMPGYNSVSFNLGANIKVSENTYLSTTSDLEFSPNLLIVPKQFFGYSLHLGLVFKI